MRSLLLLAVGLLAGVMLTRRHLTTGQLTQPIPRIVAPGVQPVPALTCLYSRLLRAEAN